MPSDTVCKTVHQYNKYPLPKEDFAKLAEIAEDYRRVKNYVYQRYGGIKSIWKIYPGYTVQNEMTQSGLREQMELPSVYFYLAIFEALGDIKEQWTQTKQRVLKRIGENSSLTAEEKHYLRFVTGQFPCFEGILLGKEIVLGEDYQKAYEKLCIGQDIARLNKYLCRQIRRNFKRMHADAAEGFAVSERAYRYGNHGIYISTKEKRKRIFVELTDNQKYKRQLYISLKPENDSIIIHAPVDVKVKAADNAGREIGLALGLSVMFATDTGEVYGEKYGEYQLGLADYIRKSQEQYRVNKKYNPGRKKYEAQRKKRNEAMHDYVNKEINRFLDTENPRLIYLPKLPPTSKTRNYNGYNSLASLWQRGYVQNRLIYKCRLQSIEVIYVFAKGISNECSQCGADGRKKNGMFICKACKARLPERENAAKNILNRGKKQNQDRNFS